MAALILDLNIIRRGVWSEMRSGPPPALDREPPRAAKAGAIYRVLGADYGTRHRIDHYFDKVVRVNDVYTPEEMTIVPSLSHLDAALDEMAVGAPIPPALRCHDLAPRTTGAGYRAVGVVKEPDFHGHSFGSAFGAARAAVEGVLRGGAAVAGEVAVYAWPLLWLRYEGESPEIVVFYDPGGGLHAYTGFPGS